MKQEREELSPAEVPQPGFKYWFGELWGIFAKIFTFIFVGLGIALLIRFGGRAAIFLIIPGILLFGTGLYTWLRIKMRNKK